MLTLNFSCEHCDRDFLRLRENFEFLRDCRYMFCEGHGGDLQEGLVILTRIVHSPIDFILNITDRDECSKCQGDIWRIVDVEDIQVLFHLFRDSTLELDEVVQNMLVDSVFLGIRENDVSFKRNDSH